MPVRSLNPVRPPEHLQLTKELIAEWQSLDESRAEPLILEERDRSGTLIHVYVVWGRWESVDRVARSEIIMDAAERCLPQEQLLNITIAMGLTADEAGRLGIR